MTRVPARTLYRLIEAGQRTHRALLRPVAERGLEPGDEAVLFVLGPEGATEADLSAQTGLVNGTLAPRIDRLIARDIVVRRAIGAQLIAGLALTERGERMRQAIATTWGDLETGLLERVTPRERRRLRRLLKRLVRLLPN